MTSARHGWWWSTRGPAASCEPGKRRIISAEEWDWIKSQGRRQATSHLLIASSLPFLLPSGMHDIEAWSEAVTDGAWGQRLSGLGEKVRIGANLDHWACFQRSYQEFEDLVIDVATGKCGPAPDTLLLFGGDVHHCWVDEVSLPDDAPKTAHEDLADGVLRSAQGTPRPTSESSCTLGHTRLVAALGRVLAKTTRVAKPRLRWRPVTRPHFRNQIGTLEIAGGEVGVRIERVHGRWRKPRMETVIEHKLL